MKDKENADSFQINKNIDTLKRLVKKFSESDNKYEFMSSRYIDLVVNDAFIDYVGNRFQLKLDDRQKQNLIIISKIFPSVLFTELFRHTVDLENNLDQIERSQVSEADEKKLHQQMVIFFLGHVILVKVLEDLNNVSAKYLDRKGIRAYHIRNLLRLTTDSGLIFDQEYKTSAYLAIASGTTKPGELVQGDVQTFTKVSVGLIDLKEYEDALRYLDRIIENEVDPNILKMAWNNKGLCLLRLKRCEEAIPFFEKVLTHDPKHLEALTNLAYCLDSVGRSEDANNAKEKLKKLKE